MPVDRGHATPTRRATADGANELHKIDRLSRLLADFAKLVESFDRSGVMFLSVTQSFSTTTPWAAQAEHHGDVLPRLMSFSAPFTPERHREILDLIQDRGRVTVAELVSRFAVSPATARRDLDELEAIGALRRTHGGAIAQGDREADPAFLAREAPNAEQKMRIGRVCAALIDQGEAVFIDAGTTAAAVARYLCSPRPSMIMTNSAPLYVALPTVFRDRLHVIGGDFRPANLSHVGAEAVAALANICFSTANIGCSAVDLRRGVVSTPNAAEAAVQRAAIARASRVILVADSSKFHGEAAAVVAPLEAITTIVTDTLDGETVEALDAASISRSVSFPPGAAMRPFGSGSKRTTPLVRLAPSRSTSCAWRPMPVRCARSAPAG